MRDFLLPKREIGTVCMYKYARTVFQPPNSIPIDAVVARPIGSKVRARRDLLSRLSTHSRDGDGRKRVARFYRRVRTPFDDESLNLDREIYIILHSSIVITYRHVM